MDIPTQAVTFIKGAIDSSDSILVREFCREFGIPTEFRLQIWNMFLQPKKEFVETKIPITAVKYRPQWYNFSSTEQEEAVKIALSIQPVQVQPFFNGIVDIAAVVVKLFPRESEELLCGMTKSLLYKFQPFYKYLDSVIVTGLQNLIHMLFLYHDPLLSLHLDMYRIEPNEYTNYFGFNLCMGMCTEFNDLIKLWDEFITFPDTTLYVYCIVGYLIYLKDDFLDQETNKSGASAVRKVIGKKLRREEVKTVVACSKAIRLSTVSSFNRTLLGVMNNLESYKQVFSKSLNSSLFLTTFPGDVINDTTGRQIPFLFIDCRRQEAFEMGSILAAINMDYLRRQRESKYVDNVFKNELSVLTQNNSTFHVVLFGDGERVSGVPDISELSMIGLDFVKRGVKRVSIMNQGYVKFHKNALDGVKGFQLMNHDPTTCSFCLTGKPIDFEKKEQPKEQFAPHKFDHQRALSFTQTIANKTIERTQHITNDLMEFLYGTPQKKQEKRIDLKIPQKNDMKNELQIDPVLQHKVTEIPKKEEVKTVQLFDIPNSSQLETPKTTKQNEEDDDDTYLKELIAESSQYDSFLDVSANDEPNWKPVITVLTTISILIVEKRGDNFSLLEDISFENITKVVMKKSEPEKFSIVYGAEKCTIKVPGSYTRFVEEITNMQQ
ncbi:hypothetical protein EIN_175590 [Entamoeba invadens IP1]|uniref:hypothetical protein n=1 Tax=Entamoeba invadens IP1 TaxID=370355 RepID=UPI0002C3F2E9|nr:hypothetical protein EIN_175590 [Entamoeba invadens IP1]ELP93772.1 hypothetical protein EIN_175590 [Entamoeba invadens IP1]|eukprot:XP_004260543.1 hypothetical protein EIN_175590 [Entamoeba invadens IP1]